MYESEGKAPNGQPFLIVKKARDYYEYSERPGMDSIAFVLYDRDSGKVGLINESKPPLDERTGSEATLTTAFGGSIDMDKAPIEICRVEVEEEAGYTVPLDHMYLVGTTMVSTQSSQMMHAYLVDITGLEKTDTTESKLHETVWMTPNEVIDNDDWKSIYICAKAAVKDII